MSDVVDLGSRRPAAPRPRGPQRRAVCASMPRWIATAPSERIVKDHWGDEWILPPRYIAIRRRRGDKDTICAFGQRARDDYLASASNDR